MQAQFNEGDRVKAYGDPFSAANPDKVSPAAGAEQVHRDAVIVRQMPYSLAERGYREYEVTYADGGSEDLIVHEDRLRRA